MGNGLLQGIDRVKRFVCAIALFLGIGFAFAPAQAHAETLADGTYIPRGLSTAVMNMYKFDANASRVVVRGGDAWLITSPSNANTLNRYDGMAYGPQSAILDESDPTNHTLVAGTPVANVVETYGADGETVVSRSFVLPVSKSVLEDGGNIYYMIKYRAGYSADHDGDWYKASNDYYLKGYTLEFESDSTALPGEDPAPIDEPFDLTITNAIEGLTATQASVIPSGGGLSLVVDVAGDARYLFVGTLGQALASGSTDSPRWIFGTEQDDGSIRFTIPISTELTYLPFSVAASATSDIAADVHPYQFIIDYSEETLRLERYDNVFDISVSVDSGIVPDFDAGSTASIRVIGGPNDTLFKCVLTLPMDDSVYDYAEYNSLIEGGIARAGSALSDGSFLFVFENSGGKKSFTLGSQLPIRVHHVDGDLWLNRMLTIDLEAGTVTIGGSDDSVELAKALIAALPRDPTVIRDGDSDAIAKAAAAYNALSGDAQAQLDTEKPPFSTVPYGRILENAQWALDALGTVNSSTSLPDGVYTTGIESAYDLGKTPSSREKGFTIKSITVRNGVATAHIEHESTTNGVIYANGRQYPNNPVENGRDYRTYDVPVDLNSTFHIVWKAQDAGSSVTGVSVEMTNSIDESRTAPDEALPADDSASEVDTEEIERLLEELARMIAAQGASSGKTANASNTNATTASNNAALASALASRNSGSNQYGTTGTGATGANPSATRTSGSDGGALTGGMFANALSPNGLTTSSAAPFALAAVLLCAAALGALGFSWRFVRREEQR